MYIPITLGAVPDAVMVCGGQSLPRLWTLEREVTGNPRLLVPRTRLAVVIRHGEVTVPLAFTPYLAKDNQQRFVLFARTMNLLLICSNT